MIYPVHTAAMSMITTAEPAKKRRMRTLDCARPSRRNAIARTVRMAT
jgi:hypothetical protein